MLILFLLDRLALCAQPFDKLEKLHILLVVFLRLDQLRKLFLSGADLCHRLLIRIMRVITITVEKLTVILEHVLARSHLFLLKQQRAFFNIQLFHSLFGTDAVEFKALLTQIIRADAIETQEIAVHGDGHSSFFGDGVLIVAHFTDVHGIRPS